MARGGALAAAAPPSLALAGVAGRRAYRVQPRYVRIGALKTKMTVLIGHGMAVWEPFAATGQGASRAAIAGRVQERRARRVAVKKWRVLPCRCSAGAAVSARRGAARLRGSEPGQCCAITRRHAMRHSEGSAYVC